MIKDELFDIIKDTNGVFVEIGEEQNGPPRGKPISINIEGQDIEVIQDVAREVLGIMNSHDAVRSVESTLPPPGIEWRLNVDRSEATKFGFDISTISSFVRLVTGGTKLSTYRPDDSDEEIDVRMRFPEEYRNLSQLDNLNLSNRQGGQAIPLSHFATRELKSPTGSIRRIDGQRLVTVSSDVAEGENVNEIMLELEESVAKLSIPDDVVIRFCG